MKVINFKNAIVGTACAAIFMLCSSNVFGACAIPSCPPGQQLTYEGPNCYCFALNNPMSGGITQLQDTSINTNTKDFGITTGIITNTTTDASTECEVKQVGEDFVRCCKDEVVTPPTEGPTSTPQVTTGNGNENGCGNQCHTSCSNYGGTVYTGLGSWTGGTLVSAANCRDGCYCIKGATAGGTSANSGIITNSGGTSGSSTTELSGGGSGGLSGSSGTPYQGYQGNLAR